MQILEEFNDYSVLYSLMREDSEETCYECGAVFLVWLEGEQRGYLRHPYYGMERIYFDGCDDLLYTVEAALARVREILGGGDILLPTTQWMGEGDEPDLVIYISDINATNLVGNLYYPATDREMYFYSKGQLRRFLK